jgi:hypothetical protein
MSRHLPRRSLPCLLLTALVAGCGGGGGDPPTAHNNVQATANPTAVTAIVGAGSQPLVVTFATDGGNPAANLSVTGLSALPVGWSSTAGQFSCATVSVGTGCQLDLAYAPQSATSGTLTLTYSYVDESGTAKTGSIGIPYRAEQHLYTLRDYPALGMAPDHSTVYSCSINSDGSLSNCAAQWDDIGTGGTVRFHNGYAYIGLVNGNAITTCPVNAVGSFLSSNCTYEISLGLPGGGVGGASGVAFNDNNVYIVSQALNSVIVCSVSSSDGSFSNCTNAGGTFGAPTAIAISGSYAYVAGGTSNASTVSVCTIDVFGDLTGCASTGSGFASPADIVVSGNRVYVTNSANDTVSLCTVTSDGGLSGCTNMAGGFSAPYGVAVVGTFAYVANATTGLVSLCKVGPDGTFGACANTSAPGNAGLTAAD